MRLRVTGGLACPTCLPCAHTAHTLCCARTAPQRHLSAYTEAHGCIHRCACAGDTCCVGMAARTPRLADRDRRVRRVRRVRRDSRRLTRPGRTSDISLQAASICDEVPVSSTGRGPLEDTHSASGVICILHPDLSSSCRIVAPFGPITCPTCPCMCARMYVCMHACMYACMHVCMHTCMHACVCTAASKEPCRRGRRWSRDRRAEAQPEALAEALLRANRRAPLHHAQPPCCSCLHRYPRCRARGKGR